jgi:hypothetical protein
MTYQYKDKINDLIFDDRANRKATNINSQFGVLSKVSFFYQAQINLPVQQRKMV